MKNLILSIIFLSFFVIKLDAQRNNPNPPAPGFHAEASDAKAIEIADEVMNAMGGRQGWDETRYIVWTFFGRRKLFWDKYSGDVRVETEDITYLVNINENSG